MIEEMSGDFVKWLRSFYQIAEEGSLRKASASMGINQPTISRQITLLEKELGVTLFDRAPGKVMQLTPEGKVLQVAVLPFFEGINRIKGKFQDRDQEFEGKIVIATTHAVIDHILPPFVERFKKQHPRVLFHFEGILHDMVCEKVASEQADFGIAICDQVPKVLSAYDMFEDNLVLIAPKGNRFFPEQPPSLRQIAQAPLILFSYWGKLKDLIEQRFAEEGLRPNIEMTHNNFWSIKNYVAKGMGVTILGSHVVSAEDEQRFDIFSLDRYFPKRRYRILLKNKYFSPMLRSFLLTIHPDIQFAYQNPTVRE